MTSAPNSKKSDIRLLTLFCVVLSLGILLFGLKPKVTPISNNVQWLINRAGLRFGQDGMAYSEQSAPLAPEKHEGLTIEIALQAHSISSDRFKSILMLHGGLDASQLMIGQWRTMMIIMNGNDYNGRQRTRKIILSDALLPGQTHLVTVTSTSDGTQVYLDGKLAANKKGLHLTIPFQPHPPYLMVGNSVYGKQSWTGNIYGLAIFTHALERETIEQHYTCWQQDHNLDFINSSQAQWHFTFRDKGMRQARNEANPGAPLLIPEAYKILKKEILVLPRYLDMSIRAIVIDIGLNFLGFIPLGIALNALFTQIDGWLARRSWLATTTLCMILSFAIEIGQAWIPSRSSDISDLILNTLGAAFGAGLFKLSRHRHLKKTTTGL